MSMGCYISIYLPKKALNIPEIREGLESCFDTIIYNENPLMTYAETHQGYPYDFAAFENLLVSHKIPFDRSMEVDENIEHYVHRPDAKFKSLLYTGQEPTVPSHYIWNCLESVSNLEELKKRLLIYMERHSPQMEPLNKAIQSWEERNQKKDKDSGKGR